MINIKSYKLSNGVKLPSILLGSYQVKDVATLEGILKSSLENGVYGFDTSPSYGNLNLFGEVLSKAVKETKTERKKLFVQAKLTESKCAKPTEKSRSILMTF
jgi:diketogulonate reductase-like aldo/keto reductase